MKIKHLLFRFIFFFCSFTIFSQTIPSLSQANITPNGIFDTIIGISKTGPIQKFHLSDLDINKKTIDGIGNSILSASVLCSTGYFEIYGESGCGFEPVSNPTLNILHTQRLNVLCQVFTDLSGFIINKGGNANKVRYIIKNQSVIASAATSMQLGQNTQFLILPQTSIGPIGGIMDYATWLTINTGQDAYYNLISPYNSNYYHAMLAFNFSNPGILWNTNLTGPPATGEIDLYTTILHEVAHSLGFFTLIDYPGTSRVIAGPYYARYDKFLQTQTGIPLLAPINPLCPTTTYSWNIAGIPNPSLTLSPGGSTCLPLPSSSQSNSTTCSTAIKFVGTNTVNVYTQNCFTYGGSLMHFEDECAPVPPGNNDLYFLTSNSSTVGPLSAKRFFTDEERSALCDLGYNVTNTFGAGGNYQHTHYYSGAICPGISVAGVNDGILSNGLYAYNSAVGITSTPIFPLVNDVGSPVSFSCLQLIYGSGAYSPTSGTSFTFNPSSPGLHVFRYIPVSGSGEQGNITYISYYAYSNSCNNTCGFINNGGFESSSGCGTNINNITYSNSCWTPALGTPDFFKRNCLSVPGYGIPVLGSIDTWNAPSPTNNTFYGLAIEDNFNESIQGQLSTPLINGNTYNFQGWFYTKPLFHTYGVGAGSVLSPNSTLNFDIAASSGPYAPGPSYVSTYPTGVTTVTNIAVPNNNAWTFLSTTFTYTGSLPANFIHIRLPYLGNVPANTPYAYLGLIDDITILSPSVVATFTPPSNICLGQNIPNLGVFVSPSGGTFSGNGVIFGGGNYAFNSTIAGLGTHNIVYTYTTGTGCVITTNSQISVIQPLAGNLTISGVPTVTQCPNTNFTASLYVAGVSSQSLTSNYTFTWLPANATGTVFSDAPSSTTVYTLIGQDVFGCSTPVSLTFTVDVGLPTVTVTPTSQTICLGQTATLTAMGQASGGFTFYPTFMNGPVVTDNPTVTTTYTIDASHIGNCITATTAIVNVLNCGCVAPSTLSGTLTSSPVGTSFAINSNISIQGIVVFQNSEFKIASNVIITVEPGASLRIRNSHLYACGDMWKGIIVKPGGQIEILQNSFVEDAINAVYADFPSGSGTIIDVSDAIFNRNFVAITIKNYSQPIAAYPFNIKKSIFTCRNIPFSGLSWPSYNTVASTCAQPNPLSSPYCLQNYPTDVLKAPKSGEFSQTGIYLENVGLTQTPGTSPVYYDIKIGDYFGPPSPTIFDNLLFGIDALESNIICYQSVFQNTNYVFSSKKYFGGIGINSISNKDARRLMLTPPTPFNTLRKNKFYDCHHAINGWNIFECDIRNIDFRSTQGAIAKFNRGKFGIIMSSNRFKNYNINSNTFYNISNSINFNALYGAFASFSNGQYAGTVNINYNIISPTVSGPPTTQFVENAIYLQNIISSPSGTAQTILSGAAVNVNGNRITDAYRGIFGYYFSKPSLNAISNYITLRDDPQFLPQYGINENECSGNVIQTNTIVGTGTVNTQMTGVYSSLNSNQQVICNTISNSYQGFEFAGLQPATQWFGNKMKNHQRGFVLSNNGIIGAQGSGTYPMDNQWLGSTWTFTNYSTWTSASTSSLSALFSRTITPFFPNNNSGAPNPFSYAVSGLSVAIGPFYSCSSSPATSPSLRNQIAQDNLYYFNPVSETKQINKNKLYRELKHDPTLMISDSTLQNFFISSQTTSREIFAEIEENLSVLNTSIAGMKINVFYPANNIESNYKNFYTIYKNYINANFTSLDSSVLANLIQKCPFTDGAVVYQARALFNLINRDVNIYTNNCINQENNRAINPNNFYNSSSNWDIEMFPNPTTSELHIISNQIIEELKINIIDAAGKIVSEHRLITDEFIGKINFDLSNGIYFINFLNSSNEKITKKLVIVR